MEQKTTITFQAAECGEFHTLGRCVECKTLKEAYRIYQRFLKTSREMCPSLEFTLHHADDPLYSDLEYPLCMAADVRYFEQHPLVQEAVRELEQLEEVTGKKDQRRHMVR